VNAETSAYAEELISILQSLAWDPRVEARHRSDGAEEIGLRCRVRELLVLRKGNDVLGLRRLAHEGFAAELRGAVGRRPMRLRI
jgi:hypothetical protein